MRKEFVLLILVLAVAVSGNRKIDWKSIPNVKKVSVVSLDPPDLRGVPVYRIIWTAENGTTGMIHRVKTLTKALF